MQIFKILTVAECSDLAAKNMALFQDYIAKLYAAYHDGYMEMSTFIDAKMQAYQVQREEHA